jgi:hypothetical protein
MEVLDTPYVHYEVKDDILFATYKKGVRIDLDIARRVVEDRLNLTGRKGMVALVFNHGVMGMDKEARDFLSSPSGNEGLKAGAIIANNEFTSLLGNFFLSVNRPNIPARMFTNVSQARKWLEKYK